MTNYITAVGVQQFSITIASGSTTGTATISAVGSGAFIIYGGINPSVNANPPEDYAYLTLTNSTTITATRNLGTAGTVVITGCIIDGDTTNLIKSVQFGTISVAAASATGTATITAVTNNNTAIHFLGIKTANTSELPGDNFFSLSLSGTTVTATRGQAGSSDAATVSFVAIEFQGAALNQAIQNVSANSSALVTSFTATITSVNTNNTVSIFGGTNIASGTVLGTTGMMDGQLTNATTFTVNVNNTLSASKTYNASIVEFAAGVLNSNVQRGTTTLTGVASNTSTITSVTAANSGISFLNNTSSAANDNETQIFGASALTNSTTVTTTKNSATNNITSSWEVFEFPAFSGGVTQKLNSIWFGAIA